MPVIRQDGSNVLVDVLVQPRASRNRIGPVVGDRLKVAVTAPPVDGKANAAVVLLLAEILGVPRRQVDIASGESSRKKTVRLRDCNRAHVLARIPEAT